MLRACDILHLLRNDALTTSQMRAIIETMQYIISDIHGEYGKFMRLLDAARFCDGDLLVCCGDAIDKGKDSIRVVRQLLSMKNAVYIMGNHEYDFAKYFSGVKLQYGDDRNAILNLLRERFPADGDLLDWDTAERLCALPGFYETSQYVCVHAGAPLDAQGRLLPLHRARIEQLVYDRDFKEKTVLPQDGRCVFFGHTPTVYIDPRCRILAYLRRGAVGKTVTDYCKIHLDTGVYLTGTLGMFRVEDCHCFYVSERA